MKERAATAAIAGTALVLAAPMAGCLAGSATCNPAPEASRVSDADTVVTEPSECSEVPEIGEWSARRRLDPQFVRAIAITQSGLDACAAAMECDTGVMEAPCREPGPARDTGYGVGLDEMQDPSGVCSFDNATTSAGEPAWRWLGLGLMQTLEPPYTFWPAQYNPDGVDGQYYRVLQDSPVSVGMNLGAARACNPRFNPFNAGDSACLGTFKLARLQNTARAWVASNLERLGLKGADEGEVSRMVMYVTAHMYNGTWSSSTRRSDHPRCDAGVPNGACWAYGFSMSRVVTEEYCGSSEGHRDSEHCTYGRPRYNPPQICNGRTDFIQYIHDCEAPYLQYKGDYGEVVLQAYDRLGTDCRNR